jgi:hypothetical protein
MQDTYGGPAAARRHLSAEFARFYDACRCGWAPANPDRAFGLAFKSVYPEFDNRVSEEEVLAAAFDALGYPGADRPGLFRTFDPGKYSGGLPLEDHFLNLFARKLRGKLESSLRRTTDNGRPGDPDKFRPNPALGLLRGTAEPAANRTPADDLRADLGVLTDRQRAAVWYRYWAGLSDRDAGRRLGLDHKTVAKDHRAALARLRPLYGAEGVARPD